MDLFKQLRSQTNILNLPNCLTLLRIILIPFMALLLEYDGKQLPFEMDSMFRYSHGRVAAFVVLLAGITDLLDGYYARKWKIESLLGKFLDPIADKLLLLVGLVMLMKLGRVEAWLVIALLSREFLVTALRAVAAGEGLIIAAGQSGKIKLTFQLIGLGFLMWYGSAFGLSAVKVGTWILYIALFTSLLSGYHYLRDFFIARKAKANNQRGNMPSYISGAALICLSVYCFSGSAIYAADEETEGASEGIINKVGENVKDLGKNLHELEELLQKKIKEGAKSAKQELKETGEKAQEKVSDTVDTGLDGLANELKALEKKVRGMIHAQKKKQTSKLKNKEHQ